jgi:hypothetical protein
MTATMATHPFTSTDQFLNATRMVKLVGAPGAPTMEIRYHAESSRYYRCGMGHHHGSFLGTIVPDAATADPAVTELTVTEPHHFVGVMERQSAAETEAFAIADFSRKTEALIKIGEMLLASERLAFATAWKQYCELFDPEGDLPRYSQERYSRLIGFIAAWQEYARMLQAA